jgi:hypothetical protein
MYKEVTVKIPTDSWANLPASMKNIIDTSDLVMTSLQTNVSRMNCLDIYGIEFDCECLSKEHDPLQEYVMVDSSGFKIVGTLRELTKHYDEFRHDVRFYKVSKEQTPVTVERKLELRERY